MRNDLYTLALDCTGTVDLLRAYIIDCNGDADAINRLACGLALLHSHMETLRDALDPCLNNQHTEVNHARQ